MKIAGWPEYTYEDVGHYTRNNLHNEKGSWKNRRKFVLPSVTVVIKIIFLIAVTWNNMKLEALEGFFFLIRCEPYLNHKLSLHHVWSLRSVRSHFGSRPFILNSSSIESLFWIKHSAVTDT
jgi:hypothetical protein